MSGTTGVLAKQPLVSQVWICRSTVLPSSTPSFAPAGRLSPSGNCISATGVWVSLGTRMLTSATNCPVLLNTAFCSIAHSSGASRLALLQPTAPPGGTAGGWGALSGALGAADDA